MGEGHACPGQETGGPTTREHTMGDPACACACRCRPLLLPHRRRLGRRLLLEFRLVVSPAGSKASARRLARAVLRCPRPRCAALPTPTPPTKHPRGAGCSYAHRGLRAPPLARAPCPPLVYEGGGVATALLPAMHRQVGLRFLFLGLEPQPQPLIGQRSSWLCFPMVPTPQPSRCGRRRNAWRGSQDLALLWSIGWEWVVEWALEWVGWVAGGGGPRRARERAGACPHGPRELCAKQRPHRLQRRVRQRAAELAAASRAEPGLSMGNWSRVSLVRGALNQ